MVTRAGGWVVQCVRRRPPKQSRPPSTTVHNPHRSDMAAPWRTIAALLVTASATLARNCDLYQYVNNNVKYNIKSPDYPADVSRSCRWRAVADANSRLELTCNEFKVASSPNCQDDVLLISLSGDDGLRDAHRYCGKETFSLRSDANELTMELRTFYGGGRFLCTITALPNTSPPPSASRCGIKKQSRIVGGEETGVNEFPFMAALVDAGIRKVFCGATIVSAHYVLTTAHCTRKQAVEKTGVLVGDHNLTTGEDTKAAALYRVDRYYVHKGFDARVDNDIALVHTEKAIAMSNEVMPACLPINLQSSSFTNETVTVLGWGTMWYGGAPSDVLLKADLRVLSPQQCSAVYGDAVSTRQMCTYNKGKDACQFDSGGPLYYLNPSSGLVYVIGLVSHGIQCGTTAPGVNTRVTSYIDWITNIIGGEAAPAADHRRDSRREKKKWKNIGTWVKGQLSTSNMKPVVFSERKTGDFSYGWFLVCLYDDSLQGTALPCGQRKDLDGIDTTPW